MSELFREIEDDIRQERLEKLWRRFGPLIIGVSLAVIAATIGIVVMQNHKRSFAMQQTAHMLQGVDRMNAGDFKGAIPVFAALAQNPTSPYYGLAMLRKGQAEAALDEQDEAKKTYGALAQRDNVFGALAKMLSYGNAATGEVIAPPDKNAPLYYSQSEFRSWQLLQKGKKTEAADQFAALARDIGGPPSIRERTVEVLQYMAPEKLKEKTYPRDAMNE